MDEWKWKNALFENYDGKTFKALAELFSKTAIEVCEGQRLRKVSMSCLEVKFFILEVIDSPSWLPLAMAER